MPNQNLKHNRLIRHRHKSRNINNNYGLFIRITTSRSIMIILSSLLLLFSQQISAFNIDTQSPLIHQGPAGSYFGFTVAEHRDRGASWLLVGAPKAQTDQPRTNHSGAVYRCSTTSPANACQQIPFDPNGSSMLKLRGETKQGDDKSYQWFGASLHSANDNGSFVACAPRYVYFSAELNRRDPVGTCWVSRGSFSGFFEYSPCRHNDQWGHHHLGSCQAGFSSAITKDGSRVFMGAPGAHVWQGQVFGLDLKTDLSQSTSAVNPHSEDDSLLGYSITPGRFTSKSQASQSGADSDLAIGIPRAEFTAGKVMLVDSQMRTLFNLTGEQVGSRFGESLAVADINNDGLDDLLIGAPYFYNNSERHFDRGRVYVYLQNNRHEMTLVQKIDGLHNGGRLGVAIASAGDLNRDGFTDIAIGAPYGGAEGRGAVYIFMGKKGGLSDEPDQVIAAESIRGESAKALRGFGYSLSGGLDMDGNAYPDLLIGSYASDRAVMLRSRPVVSLATSLTFTPKNFNLDDKVCTLKGEQVPCITGKYCAKYSGHNVETRLPFKFDIKLDSENTKGAPRLFFLNKEGKSEDSEQVTLSKDSEQCRSFKAYISRQIRDKLTPIKIDVDYSLLEQESDSYESPLTLSKLKPVLNKSAAPNRLSESASIQKNCGQDNVCEPDLRLTVNPNLSSYTIGSNEEIILDVTVKNLGEDAYESMFYLTMPTTINYDGVVNRTRTDYPICYGPKPEQTGINQVTCELGNPMARNEIVKFAIQTKPARGVYTTPDFTFVAHVNSTNPEPSDRHREDNQVAIGIPIRVETDLQLSGNSLPPNIVYNSTETELANGQMRQKLSEADLGPEIYHIYQMQNKGPSTISEIAVTILWPSKNKDGQYLLYLVDEPVTNEKVVCKPSPDNVINPLNLKYLPGQAVKKVLQRAQTLELQQQQQLFDQENKQQQPQGTFRYISRQKRQASYNDINSNNKSLSSSSQPMGPTFELTDQQLNLACTKLLCDKFYCTVMNLGHQETATIKIRSRLYEDTLKYLSQHEFEISSKLVAQVKALPYNVSTKYMPTKDYNVVTLIHTTGLTVKDLLPWWLLLFAIILGLILLGLLALCLKSMGFFARKRPPKGKAEREPLTPTLWNNYQYSPGDTAL